MRGRPVSYTHLIKEWFADYFLHTSDITFDFTRGQNEMIVHNHHTCLLYTSNSWNDYFMQLIMLSSTSNLTMSLGIAKLQAENSTDFGLIVAGAALASVPIIIIFLIFQKYFTKGIAMGAVKG